MIRAIDFAFTKFDDCLNSLIRNLQYEIQTFFWYKITQFMSACCELTMVILESEKITDYLCTFSCMNSAQEIKPMICDSFLSNQSEKVGIFLCIITLCTEE